MGCCSSTATAPSELPSPPAVPHRTASVPVPPQNNPEMSPIPLSRSQTQRRSRTSSAPEPTLRRNMSSQDSDPRISMMSAPQPPQSSRSSSSQNHRTRVESPAALIRINRLPKSLSRAIQASIEYVVCLPTLVSFICLVLRDGRSREFIDITDIPILTNCFPVGYWRNLWSNLDFADKPVKDCVNVIHTNIVRIWKLDDRNGVSVFQLPLFKLLNGISISQVTNSR